MDPATAAGMVVAGWTPDTFAICASSPDDLEANLDEIAAGVTWTFQKKKGGLAGNWHGVNANHTCS